MKRFFKAVFTQFVSILVVLFFLNILISQAALTPGEVPYYSRAFNVIFGEDANANIETTISNHSDGIVAQANTADMVDNVHAKEFVTDVEVYADTLVETNESGKLPESVIPASAASSGDGGTLVTLYTTTSALGTGWECIPISKLKRLDGWTFLSQGDGVLMGGGLSAWNSGYHRMQTHAGEGITHLCLKTF